MPDMDVPPIRCGVPSHCRTRDLSCRSKDSGGIAAGPPGGGPKDGAGVCSLADMAPAG